MTKNLADPKKKSSQGLPPRELFDALCDNNGAKFSVPAPTNQSDRRNLPASADGDL